MEKSIKKILIEYKRYLIPLGLVVLGILAQIFYAQFDFTQDRRHTFSETTKNILKNVNEPLYINVFLSGDYPAHFKQLEYETRHTLETMSNINDQIRVVFIDPNDNDLYPADSLVSMGFEPNVVEVVKSGAKQQVLIFPYALIGYRGQLKKVSLLVNKQGVPLAEQLSASIESLEYNLVSAVLDLTNANPKKVGFLTHHDELPPLEFYGFLKTAGERYQVGQYKTDSLTKSLSEKDLTALKTIDLLVMAKPVKPFSESDKLILDQYLMNGGKIMMFLDYVNANMDSLNVNPQQRILAYPVDLNLTDWLFSYGIRVNSAIVKDAQAAPIRLSIGNVGGNHQYSNFPWPYFPLVFPSSPHPITKNINPVKFEFATTIDTLPRKDIKYTPLLQTSPYNAYQKSLSFISLSELTVKDSILGIEKPPKILAVLAQGRFESSYSGRVEATQLNGFKSKSPLTSLLVVSDGDVIKNQSQNGNPFPLGFDKWLGVTYGNGAFVQNAMDYMLDEHHLIDLKLKEHIVRPLNQSKSLEYRGLYQMINLLIPLGIIGFMGFMVYYFRRKQYDGNA